MAIQGRSVTAHSNETLFAWVESGEIAIPEIQRPFVWDATRVRNLLDSLCRGHCVGYRSAWRNPTVELKDDTPSAGKRVLIDGQRRVTGPMAALVGREVPTRDCETVRGAVTTSAAGGWSPRSGGHPRAACTEARVRHRATDVGHPR
jgi:hypothetical protein